MKGPMLVNSYAIVPFEDIKKDDFVDDVGVLLMKIRHQPKWNKQKYQLKEELIEKLADKDSHYFVSDSYRYHVGQIGASYLYDVPENKRGNLKAFRGKRVRLVCVGSGSRAVREYMVMPIE